MFAVSFSVTHTLPDGDYDRDKCVAEFNSLTDALTWCGFYHHKQEEPHPDGYFRDWCVRGIFSDIASGRLDCDPSQYLSSDLSWDEIDSLPVNDIDQTIH